MRWQTAVSQRPIATDWEIGGIIMVVTGVVGCPWQGGDTDTMVSAVLNAVNDAGGKTGTIYLTDLDIRPCQACQESPAPGYCRYEDDMDQVYAAMETSDAVVVGSPAYYDSLSAALKMVVDRSNCLAEPVELPDGRTVRRSRLKKEKKGIFIWVADAGHEPRDAMAMLRDWFEGSNIELVDTIIVTDAERAGGPDNRPELLAQAYESGCKLAASLSGNT